MINIIIYYKEVKEGQVWSTLNWGLVGILADSQKECSYCHVLVPIYNLNYALIPSNPLFSKQFSRTFLPKWQLIKQLDIKF